jgi:lambda repressor-like predicted transcriptional regulator
MSSNYSGSHFLSLILGSHSNFEHIGEIKWLTKVGTKSSRALCGLCGGHDACPVLSGVSNQNLANVYEDIFANVGPEIVGLVDTSKKTSWAERFLEDHRYEKKFIHLIRDPRALVRRWALDKEMSLLHERKKLVRYSLDNMKVALLGDSTDVFINKWLKQNRIIADFISEHQLDALTVTYHDLIRHEDRVLHELMRWLGSGYETGQSDYWNFKHHGSTKTEYEWVNQKKIKHFDCRWKESLSQSQQKKVSTHIGVQKFLQQRSLVMTADGLTHYPDAAISDHALPSGVI